MKLFKSVMFFLVLGLVSVNAQANAKLSQSELKQQASEICVEATSEAYGNDAIVYVRKRVDWERDASRRLHNDGLTASVRLLSRNQDNGLSRVICNVDQNQRITLSAAKISKDTNHELFAIAEDNAKQ
ncbi:hypothetical protein [Alteromonas flava]|uniref:hypothetical protein n=1 Tax=Alteromonas flava TaxID=2048003 RepID=UPI000C293D11|nr:hypothetical protein [Alteromonas flava]